MSDKDTDTVSHSLSLSLSISCCRATMIRMFYLHKMPLLFFSFTGRHILWSFLCCHQPLPRIPGAKDWPPDLQPREGPSTVWGWLRVDGRKCRGGRGRRRRTLWGSVRTVRIRNDRVFQHWSVAHQKIAMSVQMHPKFYFWIKKFIIRYWKLNERGDLFVDCFMDNISWYGYKNQTLDLNFTLGSSLWILSFHKGGLCMFVDCFIDFLKLFYNTVTKFEHWTCFNVIKHWVTFVVLQGLSCHSSPRQIWSGRAGWRWLFWIIGESETGCGERDETKRQRGRRSYWPNEEGANVW